MPDHRGGPAYAAHRPGLAAASRLRRDEAGAQVPCPVFSSHEIPLLDRSGTIHQTAVSVTDDTTLCRRDPAPMSGDDELRRFRRARSGLASGLALAVRPAGSAEAPRARVGPEDAFCGAVRKDLRVPLRVKGPTRTMRGIVPAPPVTFYPAPGTPGMRRPARPTRGAQASTSRYGGVRLRRGAGHRRAGSGLRRCAPALEEAGQAAPPSAARVPSPLAAVAQHSPARSRSPCWSCASFARSVGAGRLGAPKVRP